MRAMFEKTLRTLALTGIFTLPFVVFIVASSYFFPFITGKNFSFRIIIDLVAGLWLALALVNPEYRPRRSWLFYALSAFIVTILAADIFGVNPAKSIGSNFERMEGWVGLFHLYLFFIVSTSLMTDKLWKYWWHTTLGASVLICLYGVFQLLGFAEIHQGGVRLDATLGNATYLAIYTMFHVFVAAILLVRSWEERGFHLWRAAGYSAVLILNAYILFFTATRGATLGLIGGALLAGILYLIGNHGARSAKYVSIALGMLLVVSAALWAARDSAFVRNSGPLQRLTSISFSDNTVKSRFMNAGMALQGFKERPILGWGQEHYAAVFDNYYNPHMWGQEPWFDRTHNVIFDWLVAGGLPGLLTYLSIHAAALWLLWTSDRFSRAERALITGLFAGYFFYLLFTFDNLMSYLLFFAFLGYIAVRSGAGERLFIDSSMPRKYIAGAALVCVLASVGLAWSVNADAMRANRTLILALSTDPRSPQKLAYFKEALSYESLGTQEIREHFSQAAMQLSNPQLQINPELKKEFVETALAEMRKQMEELPRNARFPLLLGILLNAHGRYDEAKVVLEKARSLSPEKQSIRFELAANAYNRGKPEEGIQMLREAYELAPESHVSIALYASALVRAGQIELADPMIAGLRDDNALNQRLLSAYAAANRFDKIVQLSSQALIADPRVPQAYMTRAAALYLMKDIDAAVSSLKDMKRVLPDTTQQADLLIGQMRAGTFKVN
jgi:O-antigen ligase/tetratricopeptide (TPR) repeat protein